MFREPFAAGFFSKRISKIGDEAVRTKTWTGLWRKSEALSVFEKPCLDHYEGRSFLGLHHYALLSTMAFGYLQHRRLASALRAKKTGSQCTGTATATIIASSTPFGIWYPVN
jgi:hypothetical protein